MGRLVLLVLAVLACAGCGALRGPSTGARAAAYAPEGLDPMDATPRTYDYEPSTFSKIGNAVLSVPETVVWWPYKIVSSAVRGGYDGVAGGIEKSEMPIVGVITSPITAAAGVVNGTFKGVTRGPAYIGNTERFGQALGEPWREPIPLW
ncbi:MAG: hypothetical protein HUU06_02085 [Planctomycetaceae bacterium]|nr:hypothetical protein [Planctomycetota bacterium]NUN51563.1 hypothetical protein [Planctomycetaceae bacterium]